MILAATSTLAQAATDAKDTLGAQIGGWIVPVLLVVVSIIAFNLVARMFKRESFAAIGRDTDTEAQLDRLAKDSY